MAFSQWEYKTCVSHVENNFKGFFRQPSKMIKIIVDDIEMDITDALEKLGSKGWELAGVQTVSNGATANLGYQYPISVYIFKRAL